MEFPRGSCTCGEPRRTPSCFATGHCERRRRRGNAAAAPAGDPHDITKWDVLNPASIPFARLQYDPANLASARSAHAALILFFLSEDLARAHVEAAQAINAGYQARFQRPVNYADLRNFLSLGPNAYTAEEIKWCEATIDYLGGRLSDEARLVRSMPSVRRTRGGRAAARPRRVPRLRQSRRRSAAKRTPAKQPMVARKMTTLGLW